MCHSVDLFDHYPHITLFYRRREELPEVKEDTLTVSRQMRAASPPASAADILDATGNRGGGGMGGRNSGGNRPGIKRSMMARQRWVFLNTLRLFHTPIKGIT